MPTADWNGGEPIPRAFSGKPNQSGGRWAARRVKRNGTVRLFRRDFEPRPDVQVRPEAGELLLFFAYGTARKLTGLVAEWTAPADPDGFIRRQFWQERAAVHKAGQR